jgi:hypothetical protein
VVRVSRRLLQRARRAWTARALDVLPTILVASLQTAFSAMFLVAASGSCCSGLGTLFLSLRSNPPEVRFSWSHRQALVAAASGLCFCRFAPTRLKCVSPGRIVRLLLQRPRRASRPRPCRERRHRATSPVIGKPKGLTAKDTK